MFYMTKASDSPWVRHVTPPPPLPFDHAPQYGEIAKIFTNESFSNATLYQIFSEVVNLDVLVAQVVSETTRFFCPRKVLSFKPMKLTNGVQ